MTCRDWYKEAYRKHFAVLRDGELVFLGKHDDLEVAQATANDKNLDWVIVITGETALSWRGEIGWITGIGGD